MLENVGHVKNPLTVVAIFAALAEVSGTLILPHLASEVQETYIWFLMLFPIVLVGIFFWVLYNKHHVLYAPTDFKDDKTFKELFENASSDERLAKIKVEQDGLGAEAPTESIDGSNSVAERSVPEISAAETLRRTFQGNAILAEELVVAKLARELGLSFERNVTIKGQKRTVFDAVATVSNRAVVAEVRFTRQGMFPDEMQNEYFERLKRFSDSLPDELRGNIEFILAVVTDVESEARLARIEQTAERIRAISSEYSFKTVVRVYQMKDLEREFLVR
ncbi:hypothetical protein HNP48_002124 [Acidovorax soli]|uniref:Uncharacterized protein n=1 Tax=Acidovorax soli TaxID=592050 RepID=A0A7X0U8P4_9BURK|nr:hypothetical protein [Acidovorax soli]MBB6559457.1 hypothetical protein [Acidovorax soli]